MKKKTGYVALAVGMFVVASVAGGAFVASASAEPPADLGLLEALPAAEVGTFSETELSNLTLDETSVKYLTEDADGEYYVAEDMDSNICVVAKVKDSDMVATSCAPSSYFNESGLTVGAMALAGDGSELYAEVRLLPDSAEVEDVPSLGLEALTENVLVGDTRTADDTAVLDSTNGDSITLQPLS